VVGEEWSTEFWVVPMARARAEEWQRVATRRSETWSYVTLTNGDVLAVDEVPDCALTKPVEAVTYPALQSQLSAWWLFHAWGERI
jgi:hypothetical protein